MGKSLSAQVKSIYYCFFQFLMMVSLKDVMISGDNEFVSVGKLRSSAELAFSQGEIEKAIQLWEKVIIITLFKWI